MIFMNYHADCNGLLLTLQGQVPRPAPPRAPPDGQARPARHLPRPMRH